MRIGIMGAGGIGAYTGARLAASGHDVWFIARGNNLATMQANGLSITSPRGDLSLSRVNATHDPRMVGPVDVVLFSVKLWDTESAARGMAPLVGPDTIVLTFQNGIDSRTMISRYVPEQQVLPAPYYISAHLDRPGIVHDTGADNRMVVWHNDNDPRVAAFKVACDEAVGLKCELAGDASQHVWRKFVVLTAFSGSTAMTRRPLGAVYGHPATRAFLRELIDEAIAVAVAEGVPFAPDIGDLVFGLLEKWSPDAYASMAVDLIRGRRLELPWLSGRVHELGERHRIPTPSHTAVYRALVHHEMGGAG